MSCVGDLLSLIKKGPPFHKDMTQEEDRQKFVNLLLRFSDGMAKCWPEHKKIQTMASQLSVILRTDIGIDRISRQWNEYLLTPLNEDVVKYAKPVNRILGRQGQEDVCTIYHAFAYGDVDTLTGDRNPLSGYINLGEILSDPSFADSREATMRYLREINKAAYMCFSTKPPACPTRPEIAAEIQRHRSDSDAVLPGQKKPITMNGTIREVLIQLAALSEKVGGDPDVIASIRDDDCHRDWVQEWHAVMQLQHGEGHATFYEACSQEAYDVLSTVPIGCLLHKLEASTLTTTSEYAADSRALISQINVLAQVHGNMPGEMRNRIEEAAQRLAGQIMSGDACLSSLDLSEIGNEVLEGCNPEDLSSLAENIGSLLPDLAGNMQLLQQVSGAQGLALT